MFVPFLPLISDLSSAGSAGALPLVGSTENVSVEIRVRFPGPTDTDLPPTELSGAIVTLSSGSITGSFGYLSMWYEKPSTTSMTGNIYLTSSAGRLQLTSASIFDGNFYNLSFVRELTTGSVVLSANRHFESEQVYGTSSLALSGTMGYPNNVVYTTLEIGSSAMNPSRGQYWAQEFRLWTASLNSNELLAHSAHYESYGRDVSYENVGLKVHWRLDDGTTADSSGKLYVVDSTVNRFVGTGSNFQANSNSFQKFLLDFAYIPSIDYGWNQKKIRQYTGSFVQPQDRYDDERFVSLEFNLYDALNENISHLMTSFEELGDFVGRPMNRYRGEYEGLRQMRETYFKRLQGQLSFRTFVDMLEFFDTSFVDMIRNVLPARALFKGDELIVESHILERPKFQYWLRPIHEGTIEVSGSITVSDFGPDDIFE